MRNRNKKLIILVALVAVVTISVGFAAFSSSLLIKSSLSVNPTSGEFYVVFSSNSTDVTTDNVTVSTSHTAVNATEAEINNDGTYPTISNLGGTFTSPGQSITYTFYALNTGKYDAYLTSIVFQELSSGAFKECEATDGSNSDLVTSACSDISVKVQVGSEEVTSTKLGIEDHQLLKGTSETITITLTYESNGALADEPFTVNFGNIYLTYGTQETSEMPSLPVPTAPCTLVDADSNGVADIGEVVTCGSENFYTIENNTTTIAMLTEKNITVADLTTGYPVQSDDEGYIAFAETGYWYTDGYDEENNYIYLWVEGYEPEEGQVYPFVYDSNSLLYPYVEAYEDYLQSMEVSSASATLINYEQLIALGCSEDYDDVTLNSCYDAPSWVYSTDYWLGFSYAKNDAYRVWHVTHGYGTLDHSSYDSDGYVGIRPVVTISTSELG